MHNNLNIDIFSHSFFVGSGIKIEREIESVEKCLSPVIFIDVLHACAHLNLFFFFKYILSRNFTFLNYRRSFQ